MAHPGNLQRLEMIIDALCMMAMIMTGLVCLCLVFAALILGGGAVCRFYEWLKFDVFKKTDDVE